MVFKSFHFSKSFYVKKPYNDIMTEEKKPETPETTQPTQTTETEQQPETKQEQPTQPLQEPDITECDPLTMDCKDMPDAMKELTRKMTRLETSLEQIKQLQEVFPKKKALKRLENEATKQHEQIETKITQITERYSACRPPG